MERKNSFGSKADHKSALKWGNMELLCLSCVWMDSWEWEKLAPFCAACSSLCPALELKITSGAAAQDSTIPCCAREKLSQKGLLVPFVMEKSPFSAPGAQILTQLRGQTLSQKCWNSRKPLWNSITHRRLLGRKNCILKFIFFFPRSGVVRTWLTGRFSFLFLLFSPELFWTRDPPGRNFPGKERPGWHQEAALRSSPQK